MQASPARDHDAHGYGAVCMQTFEVLQISIKERVLVVPLDLEGDAFATLQLSDVVNDVGLAFATSPVDDPLDDELRLGPLERGQGVAEPLRPLGLPASAGDDFFDRDRRVQESFLELLGRAREVRFQNGASMRVKLDLKALLLQRLEHQSIPPYPGDLLHGVAL
ncbi:hypothetical protein D3C71_1468760 [compost metagenome]